MRSRLTRRDIENANSKRQSQVLTILAMATAILVAALFRADIQTLDNILSTEQLSERIDIGLALCTTIPYILIAGRARNIFLQTRGVTGHDIASKLMTPLFCEALLAIATFISHTMFTST